MLKKRSKKALSHVDWAIALAIFLMYLAWFFIFVKPHLSPSENLDVLLDILKEGVNDNMYETISKVEINVPNDIDTEYEAVIIPFTRNYTEIAHTADHYVLDNGKMLFLANLSNTKRYTIYNGIKGTERTEPKSVIATENKATIGSFQAKFSKGLLSSIWYEGEEILGDFNIEIDETEIDDNEEFEHLGLAAKYRRQDVVNHTTYVFAENTKLYNYLENNYGEHTITISFTTYNYSNYYTDTPGELTYRIRRECKALDTDYLDLYDGSTGLLITTDTETEMMLCTNETDATVEFDLSEDSQYQIFAHDGDYTDVQEYPLTPRQGTEEEIILVDKSKILSLKNRDYQYLKTRFRFPIRRDFNITISSDAITASIGTEQPVTQDIYAKREKGYLLDENYEEKPVNITMTVW